MARVTIDKLGKEITRMMERRYLKNLGPYRRALNLAVDKNLRPRMAEQQRERHRITQHWTPEHRPKFPYRVRTRVRRQGSEVVMEARLSLYVERPPVEEGKKIDTSIWEILRDGGTRVAYLPAEYVPKTFANSLDAGSGTMSTGEYTPRIRKWAPQKIEARNWHILLMERYAPSIERSIQKTKDDIFRRI